MSDATPATYSADVVEAIVDLIKNGTDPRLADAQALLARRIATSASLSPTRIPAPRNITEVGGYFNLLEEAEEPQLRIQAIASALGLAGPMDLTPGVSGPVRFFVRRPAIRLSEDAQRLGPTHITLRDDFAVALDPIFKRLEERGCELPLLDLPGRLPSVGEPVPDVLLDVLGRRMKLVRGLALNDPATDSFVIAVDPATPTDPRIYARQVDDTAPAAGDLTPDNVSAFTCTETACTQGALAVTGERLRPLLASAGWFPESSTVPSSLASRTDLLTWRNVSGLIAGETTLGDELHLLYTPDVLAGSAVRDHLHWIWDGDAFAAP